MSIFKPLGQVLRGWLGRQERRNPDLPATPASSRHDASGPTPAAPRDVEAAPKAEPWLPIKPPAAVAAPTADVGPAQPVEPVQDAFSTQPSREDLVPAVRAVHPQPRIELPPAVIPLTDFADTSYPQLTGGFPPPPAVGPEPPPKATRAWVRRTSFLGPALLGEALQGLATGRTQVERAAVGEPVGVLWPLAGAGAAPGEFHVPEPDARFLIGEGVNKGRPRTLDLALPGSGADAASHADDFDRLELVRLLALTLQALHSADMTTARLEWSTFLFTLDPRPSVLLQRPEALRRLGAEFLVTDPQDAGSLDADRYAFALLAYRLLVSHVPVGVLDCHRQRVIPGLLPAQDRRIWQLWERSAGPEGTRPRIAEWWPALGEINELSVLGAMGGR